MQTDDPQASRRIFQTLDRSEGFPYTKAEYFKRFLWEWVQRTLIRYSPSRAARWRRFWLRLFGANLTNTSITKATTRVTHPWLLTMGEHSVLADETIVYNLGPITIGDHTVVSQRVHLCAGTHDYKQSYLPLVRPPITIGSGVWVCADAFVGPNVTVHDNALVGARSVVMRDIEPGVIVSGNPAVVVRKRPMPGLDNPADATHGAPSPAPGSERVGA